MKKTLRISLILAIAWGGFAIGAAAGKPRPLSPQTPAFWNQVAHSLNTSLSHESGAVKSRLISALAKIAKKRNVVLRFDGDDAIIAVARAKRTWIVRISATNHYLNPDGNVPFLITNSAAGWRAEPLMGKLKGNVAFMNATIAQRTGSEILLGGYMESGGNTALFGLQVFKKTSKGWKLTDELTGTREYGSVDLQSPSSMIRFITRGNPEHVVPPHIGPRATWTETYQLKKGKLEHVGSKRRNTPIWALDDLVGFILSGKKDELRQRCASDDVVTRFMAYADRLTEENLEVSPYESIISDDDPTMYLEKLGLWFRFTSRNGHWILEEFKENFQVK